jgi:membrane-bound metal-dependent hydrolase YbcI (DUF457 family)
MPVIGHAFVGIITAHEFEPGGLRNRQPLRPLARALWVPALVGLAYLPDVVTQVGLWIGYGSAKLAGHSVPLGLLAGLLIGIVWARLSGGSPRLLSALAVGSILFHDLLDLLQDTDRAPFWPITERVIGSGLLALPNRLSGELMIFGLPYALYEGWRYLRRRSTARSGRRPSSGLIWAGRGLVIMLLLSAVAVQRVRGDRRRQMNLAERLLRSGQFAEALTAADAADRWPSPANPGRADIVRGEAYEGLGDNARAEMFYLRAYQSDPENFWAVADLAEYYASHGTAAERRQRSAPYVEELRRRFSGNRSFHAVLDRVERAASRVH